MPERKAWSPEEDRTLKHLRQDLQISKWSTIAKKMAEEFDMPGRTGKQCRERYHNHLDSSILRSEWTKEEQTKLYDYHKEIGNKWAIIAQRLPGRTDNCVKNHFYSRMRKAIRKLNKTIYQHFKKDYKQIKMAVLYKIVQATDQKFKANPSIEQQVSNHCCQIKNLLLTYSNDGNNPLENDIDKLRQLYHAINQFSTKYKCKQKKQRRCSAYGGDMLIVPRFQSRNKSSSVKGDSDDNQYEDDGSRVEDSDNSNKQQMQESKSGFEELKDAKKESAQNVIQKKQQIVVEQPKITLIVPSILPKNSLSMQQDLMKVEQLLKVQGILEDSVQVNNIKKRGTLRRDDSYGIMMDEDQKNTNMLGQSIDQLKIGGDFNSDIQVDEQNNLFMDM